MENYLKKYKKPMLIVFGVLTAYGLLGFVGLPLLLETKIPELAKQYTGKNATVDKVRFDPFSLKLSIDDFKLLEEDGSSLIAFKQLYINYGLWSSIGLWAAAIDKIYLDRPFINVVRKPDGSINLAELAADDQAGQEAESESEETFPLWIGVLRINGGKVSLSDYSMEEAYHKEITDLNLDIEKIATIALEEKQDDTLSLAFQDGGVISWRGDAQLAPFVSLHGKIEIKDLNSDILWDYLENEYGYQIAPGQWNIESDYIFTIKDEETLFKLNNSRLLLSGAFGPESQVQWQGQVDVLPKTESMGSININSVDIATLWQFVPEDVEFKINQGRLVIASDYQFSMPEEGESPMQLALSNSQLRLTDLLDSGDSLIWQSENTEVMPDIHSEGQVEVKGLNIHKLWLQAQKQFDLKIQSAYVDLNSHYVFQLPKDAEQPQLLLSDTGMDAREIALSAKGSDLALVQVEQLGVKQLQLDLQKRTVAIQSVGSDNGSILAVIDKNGELNLSNAFTGRPTRKALEQAEQAVPEATSNPWLVNVQHVQVDNYLLDFTQQTPTEPLALKVTPIYLEVDGFSTAKNSDFKVKADLSVNKSGKIQASGLLSLDPLAVNLDIKGSKLSLRPFQPFLAQSSRLQLTSGYLGTQSKVKLKQGKSGQTLLYASGNVNIADLNTVEADSKKKFLQWKDVALKQFDFKLQPLSFKAKSLNVAGLQTEVIINEDKSTNLGYLFSVPTTSPAKTQEVPEKKQAKDEIDLSINKINIKDSAAFFADRSLVLPFAANIKDMNGAIKNISNKTTSRSKIYIQGEANETAPVLIQGDIEPFDFENHMNILMQFSNLSMTGMTPYMAEFAGYKIDKGKLSVNLLYKIEQSQLQADNQIVINQLTLGDEVESPNSIDVPIKLALGLLKDRNGTIDLALPVSGDLNDPEFSIWGVLGDVFLNTLTKVVASPFSAMGSLLNTDADLSQISFAPGRSELQSEQKKILDLLTQGLLQRPQLQLQIRGMAYRQEDSIGLARDKITKSIKTEVWNDMDRDERPADIDDTPVPDEEFNELLTDRFEEKFDDDQSEQLVEQAEDEQDPEAAKAYYQKMMRQLAVVEPVKAHELTDLATQRAREISNYLIEDGNIPGNRVFILGHNVEAKSQNDEIAVQLELGVED